MDNTGKKPQTLKGLRVVLVEPEYQINIGGAARACKNFGCYSLWIVRPKARVGFTARVFAKHSEELLEKAKVVGTLAEATRGCDVVVGTTGAAERFASSLKKCVAPKKAAVLCRGRKTALVFGGEGKGLSREEIEACDLIASIPANPAHPVLNLSHAVAVMLYEFYSSQGKQNESEGKVPGPSAANPANSAKTRLLERKFASALDELNKVGESGATIRDPKKVSRAFRNLLHRAQVEDDEAQALLIALTKTEKCAKKANRPRYCKN